jgi:hypothetical protein
MFNANAIVANLGPKVMVNLLVGVLPPFNDCAGSGQRVFFITATAGVQGRCLQGVPPPAELRGLAFAAGAEVPGGLPLTGPVSVFSGLVPTGTAPGTYTFFLALTSRDGSQLLSAETREFVIQ